MTMSVKMVPDTINLTFFGKDAAMCYKYYMLKHGCANGAILKMQEMRYNTLHCLVVALLNKIISSEYAIVI